MLHIFAFIRFTECNLHSLLLHSLTNTLLQNASTRWFDDQTELMDFRWDE